ncbi:SGNH/GDSL hydrolase family protein [Streptomyces sp. SCUT-3]|uniref:SGNH/GDSL hydrolase family protein n=1 Tax=Streptomyces sp. SCUT-3 TaxID=2684469 RepID=UPI0015FAD985|nr:SGNH/GDSL hydrolase family protein [Streptomyces sp. SCUT-3]QMV20570.1 SGNH/GDSL hydrolase family protein [Streptomyces sp. SCUT-3]
MYRYEHRTARTWWCVLLSILVVACTAAAVTAGRRHDAGPAPAGGSGDRGPGRAQADRVAAPRWVGTWSAAASGTGPDAPREHGGTSLRSVVRISVGGSRVRVELSNAAGREPLAVAHATVALAAPEGGPDTEAGTMRRLAFGGRPSVTVPAAGTVTSDGAALTVPDGADLVVTTYVPVTAGGLTHHPHALRTSYSARGDRAADPSGRAFTGRSSSWRLLAGVEVWTARAEGAVVALGDSLTDGIGSTPEANRRWTDVLARRLLSQRQGPRWGVLNQGIAGNRVLPRGTGPAPVTNPSGTERLERDVLHEAGARVVVVELGLNDILIPPPENRPPDARRIVAGLRALTERARGEGLRVVGSTLTPFGGSRAWNPRLEEVRQEVNRQIRAGRVFDAVVDFDRALRDPSHPSRLLRAHDSGDRVHPGDSGHRAMADAVAAALGLLPAAAGGAPAVPVHGSGP